MNEIQQVVDRIHSANKEDSPFISEEKTVLRVTPQGEFVFSPYGFALHRIYQADINNDGKEEYVVAQSDGAMRILDLAGVFSKDGRPINMKWLEQLLSEGTSEADAQMAGLMRSDKLNIQESHKVLALWGEMQSDADIGFKKENGKTYILVRRVHGALLEADDKTPFWHRAEGATAESMEYLLEPNGAGKLVKTVPVVYLGLEPLFYYQKSFGLPSLDAVTGFMETMNKAYQENLAKKKEPERNQS